MSFRFASTRHTLLTAVFALPMVIGCSDSDPVNPDPHASVQSVLVEVSGDGSVTFNRQHVASGRLTIGDNAVVAVTFRDADGESDAVANNPDKFELRVNYPGTNPAGLVFTPSPTNPFAGTFTRASTSATPMLVQFQLWHTTANHSDGEWNVEVYVE
jgi:hypothetical protein